MWKSPRERERGRGRGRRGFPSSAFTSSDFAFSDCVTVWTMRPTIRPRIYMGLKDSRLFFYSLRFRTQKRSFGQSRRGSGREREWEVGAASVAVERKTEMRSGKRQSIPSPPRPPPPPTLVSLHPSMVFRLPPTIRRPLRIPTTMMIMMMMVEAFTNKNPNSSSTINSR